MVLELLLSEDETLAEAGQRPSWVLRRDAQGNALRKPGVGGNLPTPFPVPGQPDVQRSAFDPLPQAYEFFDASKTALAGGMRETKAIVERPGPAMPSTLDNFMRGLRPLMGPTTQRSYTFAEPIKVPAGEYKAVTVSGQDVTIKMETAFPDMDYWGAFMAMGPAPLGNASKPPNYGQDPLSNGPYMIEDFQPNQELTLVKNEQWDPNSDPGRHQYVDKWVFKFNQDQAQVDQIEMHGRVGEGPRRRPDTTGASARLRMPATHRSRAPARDRTTLLWLKKFSSSAAATSASTCSSSSPGS